MKTPEHVKLERLIPIAAQLAAALHLGSDDMLPDDHALRVALKAHAQALKGYRGDDLQTAFELYKKKIDTSLEGLSPSAEFARAVGDLKVWLTERSCGKCVPKDDVLNPCSRDRPTSDVVHRFGKCIEPIKRLYEDIEKDVVELWRQIFGETQPPGLLFATKHLALIDKAAVHKDFSLTGKATIVDHPHPTTWITVAFYEFVFDWEQFTLLPGLIFHEIVCHGLQDVYDVNGGSVPRAARKTASPSCFWSEGWMDTVSHNLATEWLNRSGERHRIGGRRARLAVQWIDRYHNARYGADGQVLATERHYGREAFERIRKNITAPDFPDASALNLLIRFSVLLNACVLHGVPPGETPNERRVRIVNALDLLAVGTDPTSARRIMKGFLSTKDLSGLPT